jgi:hypothetical protein
MTSPVFVERDRGSNALGSWDTPIEDDYEDDYDWGPDVFAQGD